MEQTWAIKEGDFHGQIISQHEGDEERRMAYNGADMRIQIKKNISLALLLASLLGEAIGLYLAFTSVGESYLFYTVLGNGLYALIALILLIVEIVRYRKRTIPRWAFVLHYVGTVNEAIIFLVVCLYLVWYQGPAVFYQGCFPFLHLLCPLLALANHYFFLGKSDYRYTDGGFAFVPVVIYSAVIIPLSALGVVNPPYPFLNFQSNPWWMTLLYAVGLFFVLWLICYVLIRYAAHTQNLTEER